MMKCSVSLEEISNAVSAWLMLNGIKFNVMYRMMFESKAVESITDHAVRHDFHTYTLTTYLYGHK